ncbi:MAG: hypothetical protein WBV70_00910 [Candidatus Bathyarchaeia archaeon]
MRSNHWEYLAFVLFGLGIALTVSAVIVHFYYQQHPDTNPQYSSYPIPLLIAGICISALGLPALHRSRTKRKMESELLPPIPPPPFPPSPPPP